MTDTGQWLKRDGPMKNMFLIIQRKPFFWTYFPSRYAPYVYAHIVHGAGDTVATEIGKPNGTLTNNNNKNNAENRTIWIMDALQQ